MPTLAVPKSSRGIVVPSSRRAEDIQRDEPLCRYTSLGIGGPADYFVRPRTLADVEDSLAFAREHALPWMVLGNGTNTLFPDDGYRGLVIHLGRHFSATRIEEDRLYVQSGAGLGATMGHLRAHGFYDFDGLVGIPGTIGGALAMNAGIPEVTISEYVVSLTVITSEGSLRELSREACHFGYRQSLFRQRPWVIVMGEFQLGSPPRFDPQALLRRRRERQPLRWPSAGCVFQNPAGPWTAGQLIERVGLKGLRVGGAMISPIHGNFIVNCGGATAADVLHLIDIARNKVYKEFRVELRLELAVVSTQNLR
jgi:UDP-N-acetylmuramate dehydrogenase